MTLSITRKKSKINLLLPSLLILLPPYHEGLGWDFLTGNLSTAGCNYKGVAYHYYTQVDFFSLNL